MYVTEHANKASVRFQKQKFDQNLRRISIVPNAIIT